MFWLRGRQCELGWGYNQALDLLIEVDETVNNSRLEKWNLWKYAVYSLSSDNVDNWNSMSLFLEPSCRRFLDFQIVEDDNQYWLVHCWLIRERKTFTGYPQNPPKCGYFINEIWYGIDLRILFPKKEFPERIEEIDKLFSRRNFNNEQKETKCKLLKNYNEITETTIGEVIEDMENMRKNENEIYIAFNAVCRKLPRGAPETSFSNEVEFSKFLSYIYCAYQKIEIKIEQVWHSRIFKDFDFEKSPEEISARLQRAKNSYNGMTKNDFLRMYPVLRKLFFCYIDYIKCAINRKTRMNKENQFPGNVDEIKSWLRELNNWTPEKKSIESIDWIDRFIGTPSGYDNAIEALRKTPRFNDIDVLNDTDANEPYIRNNKGKKILFGLVNMEGAKKGAIPDDAKAYNPTCPKECSEDQREWICTNCGESVSTQLDLSGHQLLYCRCGSKKFDINILICHNPKYQANNQTTIIQNSAPVIVPIKP